MFARNLKQCWANPFFFSFFKANTFLETSFGLKGCCVLLSFHLMLEENNSKGEGKKTEFRCDCDLLEGKNFCVNSYHHHWILVGGTPKKKKN